jgi:DNA topoisomerase-1
MLISKFLNSKEVEIVEELGLVTQIEDILNDISGKNIAPEQGQVLIEEILATEEISSSITNLKKGDILYLNSLYSIQSFTEPPSRFSSASLIKKLEELGIGRPSTYASIITTLQDRGYVEPKGTSMIPTTLGLQVAKLLSDNFAEIVSSDFTNTMENQLDEIAGGDNNYLAVLTKYWAEIKTAVETRMPQIVEIKDKYKTLEGSEICPKCNSSMPLKLGRFGEFYQCPAVKEHQFPKDFKTRPVLEATEICPSCGKGMILKAGRFGNFFQCEEVKEHQFPENFKEYNAKLLESQAQFNSQLNDQKCEACKKPLIVRVSKSSLNPYIACPEYKVGTKHTVMAVTYGDCPECKASKTKERNGKLALKKTKMGEMLKCNHKDCKFTKNA